jgi:hypothetical protein
MQAKIFAKTVAKLKAGEIISDTEIRGFSARRWDTGAISYSLRYRTRNGDRKRLLIGTHGNVTPDEARKIAKQRAGEVAGGLDIRLLRKRSPRPLPATLSAWCGTSMLSASWQKSAAPSTRWAPSIDSSDAASVTAPFMNCAVPIW